MIRSTKKRTKTTRKISKKPLVANKTTKETTAMEINPKKTKTWTYLNDEIQYIRSDKRL